ncbi:TonB-dependent receptor [Sphingorhabdus arenilitoris]|uniref:TonB-dependent receptor n=1 Tax=Sphingorhabdus arenilitoris TaxID=1490041 RepID=A0ABV8RGF7_9SPHN
MKKIIIFSLPVIGFYSVAPPAWGQASKTETASIHIIEDEDGQSAAYPHGSILVVGNLPTAQAEKIEAIQQVEAKDLRLENALRSVPSLQQFRRSDARSANPTSQGVTLRGLGGNASSRALLVLDDVPQADPFGGWISWPGYDAMNLASIRVRRGAGQVASGPGALAGIIELDSLQNQDKLGGALYYGSRNSVDAKAALLQNLGQGSLSISGSYARSDGFIPIIDGQRGSVDRAAPYEQAGLAVRAVTPVSNDTELQFSARAFTDERDRGFDFSDNQNSGADASLRLVDRGGDWQWSALGYLQVREFATRFGSVANDRNSVNLVLDQFATPSTGLGARFEIRPAVDDDIELRLGADWRRTIGETRENFFFTGTNPGRNRNAGGRTDTYGGFAELTLQPNDGLTLTVGGRVDRWNVANGFRREINLSDGSVRSDDRFSNRSGTQGSGRLGLAYQLDDALKLRSSAYMGWRLPTLNELYRPFRVGADATAANELLEPERIQGLEAGADWQKGRYSFSVTAYWNRLDNAIANVTLARGPGLFPGVGFVSGAGTFSQRRNLDAVDSKGIEVEGRMNISTALSVRAAYAYVDASVISSGDAAALNGLRPAQVAKHFGSADLEYRGSRLEGGVSLRYIGPQFEDDTNAQRLKSAVTADAALSYQLFSAIRINLRAENIFDSDVQAAISNSGIVERATPRTIWVGVSADY